MSDNLDALKTAGEGLTNDESRDLGNYIIGALASLVDEKVWADALQVAEDCLARRQARTATAVEHSTTSPGAAESA